MNCKSKKDILSMSRTEIFEYIQTAQQPKYRADQIFEWLHLRKAENFDEFTNVPAQLIERLKDEFYIYSLNIEKMLVSRVDNTVKYVYTLQDGEVIEAATMDYKYGSGVCISTQAGCKMGCKFCASQNPGFVRNLTVSEMLSQIYSIERTIGGKASNITLMGIGEPLDNFDNTVKFAQIITDPKGRDFAGRKISISTCGLPERIDDLAKLKLPLKLSISLHAAFDSLREDIMPISRRFSLERVLESAKNYTKETGKRITFEYALINSINDSETDAKALLIKLKDIHCHLNLIPINKVEGKSFEPSSAEAAEKFKEIIQSGGISVTVRRTLGTDVNAACGQLRKAVKF